LLFHNRVIIAEMAFRVNHKKTRQNSGFYRVSNY